MKKKIFINSGLIIMIIVEFFLPFVSNSINNTKVSFFDISKIFFQYQVYEKTITIIGLLCLSAIIILLISVFCNLKLYKILNSFSLLIMICLNTVYSIIYSEDSNYLLPSWSFYLSLLLLLCWVAYILSPKWLPSLKKAFARLHSKHPTKSERIAQLEREVEELKKTQDESTDISSDNKKGSD